MLTHKYSIGLCQQCVYAVGLGCPTTDQNDFGVYANNDAASIEYNSLVSAYHATVMREYSGQFKIWGGILTNTDDNNANGKIMFTTGAGNTIGTNSGAQ